MITLKKSSLLAAVSAFAVVAGFAAQPASATDWSRVYETRNVDWHFTNRDIDLTIEPDDFKVAAVSSVYADQFFVGSLVSAAGADGIDSGALSNAASSVANVISVAGAADVNSGKSPFVGVVDAVQKSYGTLAATASVNNADVYGNAQALTNTATAAANVISLDTTKLALVDVDQDAGSFWHPITLNSTASVVGVGKLSGGSFDSAASSVANVVSLNVAPAAAVTNGNSHDDKRFVPNTPSIGNLTSLALVDVHQTTFANMTSLASAINVNTTGGSFSNSATSAANVVSIINKK